jgi:hypothetical protein
MVICCLVGTLWILESLALMAIFFIRALLLLNLGLKGIHLEIHLEINSAAKGLKAGEMDELLFGELLLWITAAVSPFLLFGGFLLETLVVSIGLILGYCFHVPLLLQMLFCASVLGDALIALCYNGHPRLLRRGQLRLTVKWGR